MKHGKIIGASMIITAFLLMVAGAMIPVACEVGLYEALKGLALMIGVTLALGLIMGLIIAGGCIMENSSKK